MPSRASPFRAGDPLASRVLNIGHRGAAGLAPENTLDSIELAARLGCQMVELDVQLSRDGELVVFHDDMLDRCTNVKQRFPSGSGLLSDFTWEQLTQLDAGSWFVEQLSWPVELRSPALRSMTPEEREHYLDRGQQERFTSGNVGIPRLRDALELARRVGLWVDIELKTLPRGAPGIAEAVVALVMELGMERDVLISSFDHPQLLEVRERSPDLATGVLTGDRLGKVAAYLRLLEADVYLPCCSGEHDSLGLGAMHGQLDEAGICAVRHAGFPLYAWTCNDPRDMLRLVGAGVDGIITDYPNRLHVVRNRTGLS